jgi:hypothetical protein
MPPLTQATSAAAGTVCQPRQVCNDRAETHPYQHQRHGHGLVHARLVAKARIFSERKNALMRYSEGAASLPDRHTGEIVHVARSA